MNAGRLIILRVASPLEKRDAQNERDGAAPAQQQQPKNKNTQYWNTL